jgi:flavin-dependent dehydrogenase
VIGAGPAGTAAAALLHQQGLSTLILERERFPRFQIGESLLPRSMETLEEAGLLEAVAARRYLVKRGALFLRGDQRCDFDFAEQSTPGWTWTWQVPRADFDHTLAQACEARGIPIAWRHEVTAVRMPGEGYDPATGEGGPVVTVATPEGERRDVRARYVVDASGYGRVLPRLLGLHRPSGLPTRRAIFAHVDGDRRPPGDEAGRIWVCLHPHGAWIWIIPFGDGTTSVGVVADDAFWARYPDDLEAAWRAALADEPNAAARLVDMVPRWERCRELKGYSSTVSRVHGPGFVMVGNATEFLDPVFSSGVTLALESSRLASRAVARALRGEPVDWEADYAVPLASGVDVFRTYVETWYDGTLPTIFFAKDTDGPWKPQICSVLAGYVWDASNPFVRLHDRRVRQAARAIERGDA